MSPAGTAQSEKVGFQIKHWQIDLNTGCPTYLTGPVEKVLTMPPRHEKVPIISRGMILLIAPWLKKVDVINNHNLLIVIATLVQTKLLM